MPKTVCVAVDDSDVARHALTCGLVPTDEWQKEIKKQIAKVEKVEKEFDEMLVPKKIGHKMLSGHFSYPGEGIIELAGREKADFIVIGTRGLGAVKRTLMGSVSEYVSHHSSIPVLICPKD